MNILCGILVGTFVTFSGSVNGACDRVTAASCIQKNSDISTGLMRPNTCNDWYKCIEENHCSEDQFTLPSREECQKMEACDDEQYEKTSQCYKINNQCSNFNQCLADANCTALTGYYYNNVCPSGLEDYCTEEASKKSLYCIAAVTTRHGIMCSMFWDCLKPSNCDKVAANIMDMKEMGCGTSPDSAASGIYSSFLFTASLVIVAMTGMS